MSNGYQITEEELTGWGRVDRPHLKWMEDQELLDNWLPFMEEVVGIIDEAYRKSYQLFESGQFKREPILDHLRHALITAISAFLSKKWSKDGDRKASLVSSVCETSCATPWFVIYTIPVSIPRW